MPAWDYVGFWIEQGGWGMWPLLLCSAVAYGLLLDRTLALWQTRGPTRALTDALEARLRTGDVAGALSLAASSRGSCARVATRILREALRPPTHAEAARLEALANERPGLERNVRWLRTLATLAILLGLLGTVTGLNVGFGCCPDAVSKAAMLAKAISEAMHCSAGGLLVSLIALAGYVVLRAAIDARLAAIGGESQAVVNLLVTHRSRIRWLGRRPYVEPMGYRR